MNCSDICYRRGSATRAEILAHLRECDEDFSPPLHTYTNLEDYSTKIAERAETFEAWSGDVLVGLVAAYLNDPAGRVAFATHMSVLRKFAGRGISFRLAVNVIECAREKGFKTLSLEVAADNRALIKFYERFGFERTGEDDGWRIRMRVELHPTAAD